MIARRIDINELYHCIFEGKKDRLREKIEGAGEEVSLVLDDLLLYATQQGVEDITIYLLQRGANKNINLLGGSYLMCYAAAAIMDKLLGYLISQGVDVNVVDGDGATPLYEAATNKNYLIAKMLINSGADTDRVSLGVTPAYLMERLGWEF